MTSRTEAAPWLPAALPWVSVGWILGVFVLTIWHAGGWWTAQRLLRIGSRPVSEALSVTGEQLRVLFGIRGPVRFVESSIIQVPAVVGWLKPTVLLPVHLLESLSGVQLRMILGHELAHIRRHDYVANLLQTGIETMLFFHPMVWWISNRIRDERENCCDDLAVALCGGLLIPVFGQAVILIYAPTVVIEISERPLCIRISFLG